MLIFMILLPRSYADLMADGQSCTASLVQACFRPAHVPRTGCGRNQPETVYTSSRMPGKKRAAPSKAGAGGAKRHKAGGGGAGAKSRNAGATGSTQKPEKHKTAKSIAKKDRKGKGPAFIPIPAEGGGGAARRRKRGEEDVDDEEEGRVDSDYDSEDDLAIIGEDGELGEGMDVDEDLADADGAEFLTRLDKKGMSA